MSITLGNPLASAPGVTGDKDVAQHRKLVDAAQQFEGIMLQEMLKGLQSGKGELGDDGDDSSSGGDTLRSFGTEAVATAIARGGGIGIGIAKQVVAKMTTGHVTGAQR